MAMAQHGYNVSVGRQPSKSALNVVIENFTEDTKETLMAFCRATRKKIYVIMTEHIDFDGKEIFVHGDPLWTDNDYMHPATQLDRLKNLMECSPYLRGLMVLGDLPELLNMSAMLPGLDVTPLPFPVIDQLSSEDDENTSRIIDDLLFTGVLTDFRADKLSLLKKMGFAVKWSPTLVSRRRRDMMNRATKIVLNIPQREGWRWLSGMRVIAALRAGRATVSLGTKDISRIAACCLQLDIANDDWVSALKDCIGNWRSHYIAAHQNYSSMANAFEAERGFPHEKFQYWAITDRVAC